MFFSPVVVESASSTLHKFVDRLMQRYLKCVEERSMVEAKENAKKSCNALIEGLDRFYRRLQSLSQLVPGTDFGRFVSQLPRIGQLATLFFFESVAVFPGIIFSWYEVDGNRFSSFFGTVLPGLELGI